MNQRKLQEFEPIFYPRSIAVIGASRDERKPGNIFFRALLTGGFKGKVYPVNPNEGEISGLKAYPNVRSIPDEVDCVIVAVPARFALGVLDDCAAKGVKAVQFYTAGFRESGKEEGLRLEGELVKKAREGGFRIMGPNCIGAHNPRNNLAHGSLGLRGEAGSVAFISQSGGHAYKLIRTGVARGIHLSKVVSFGNGCDLDSPDYLEYFGVDPETRIIGAYLEGIRDGHRLLELIKEISATKPIIVWKSGRTKAGAEAAASHTGALAASDTIWAAALKQAGAIKVENFEELADTLLAFQQLPRFDGRRVAIISGFVDGGGGESVSATDSCASLGLYVPQFSEETINKLGTLLPPEGSILRNPLDISQGGGTVEVITNTFELAIADPNIDVIIFQEHIDAFIEFTPLQGVQAINNIFIDFRNKQSKPIVAVLPTGLAEVERLEVERSLSQARIPVYPTLERAAKAIANMSQYYEFHT